MLMDLVVVKGSFSREKFRHSKYFKIDNSQLDRVRLAYGNP